MENNEHLLAAAEKYLHRATSLLKDDGNLTNNNGTHFSMSNNTVKSLVFLSNKAVEKVDLEDQHNKRIEKDQKEQKDYHDFNKIDDFSNRYTTDSNYRLAFNKFRENKVQQFEKVCICIFLI